MQIVDLWFKFPNIFLLIHEIPMIQLIYISFDIISHIFLSTCTHVMEIRLTLVWLWVIQGKHKKRKFFQQRTENHIIQINSFNQLV